MTNVYVLLYHDVWDTGSEIDPDDDDPNPYGEPEDVSVDGVYATRDAAEEERRKHRELFPDARGYHTIEEKVLLEEPLHA
ncbi:MAG TPA: hypothetical protein VFB50_13990 [Chloroflexota bacterium]|nr:hypothetical protein [Chloroflexota bacterium]